jgi:hypothetical protein
MIVLTYAVDLHVSIDKHAAAIENALLRLEKMTALRVEQIAYTYTVTRALEIGHTLHFCSGGPDLHNSKAYPPSYANTSGIETNRSTY